MILIERGQNLKSVLHFSSGIELETKMSILKSTTINTAELMEFITRLRWISLTAVIDFKITTTTPKENYGVLTNKISYTIIKQIILESVSKYNLAFFCLLTKKVETEGAKEAAVFSGVYFLALSKGVVKRSVVFFFFRTFLSIDTFFLPNSKKITMSIALFKIRVVRSCFFKNTLITYTLCIYSRLVNL